MSVYIACDKCEKRLKIPENVVGRPIKCPSCGSVFKADPTKVMPGKPEPHPVIEERQPAAVAPRRAAPAADEDDDDVRPVRKPAALDDDDEDLPKPRKKAAALDDDDEGIVTAKKKVVAAEDDEDEVRPARKKAAAVDDDDEDRPARRKKPAVDDDEDEDEEEDKAKKSKRRTPWYVMLPLLVLSLSGAGLAALWTIGFSYLDMDRGLAHLSNFDNKVWIGVSTAGVITLLCLIVTLIPARSWLRFLLVFLFLGIGYGGSFAAIHWWKDLPLPAEEKPADQPPPEGGPMGPPGGPPMGPRGGPPMGPPGGPPMGPPRGGRGPGGDAPVPPP